MKIVLLTCVWGRHETVKECIELSPSIERVAICSTDEDEDFLLSQDIEYVKRYENLPLSNKWNYGVECLRDIDFDYVIMMGSDDYFNQNLINFIKDNDGFDMIAFTDIYFKSARGDFYYWGGYESNRVGEPAGAGKTYSKEYLERIDYNLFPVTSNKGLDGISWVVVNHTRANMLITSLKQNDLFLCDIKDGEGITPLEKIRGIKKL